MAAVFESILPKKIGGFLHQLLMAARAGKGSITLIKQIERTFVANSGG
jgi:hypothetical protein